MLNLDNCRRRQTRLLSYLAEHRLDAAVLSNPKLAYYFTGALVDPARPQAFVLTASGGSLLATNAAPALCAAERVETYTGYSLQRVFSIRTMAEEAARFVSDFVGAPAGRIGADFEFLPMSLRRALGERDFVDLTPLLEQMRRRKDPDEVESIRATIALTEAGYGAIKKRLEPGMTEFQAYSIMNEAMVNRAHTSLPLLGDFACGVRAISEGGAPTSRRVEPGDLYILDIFPSWQGYVCDLCRTFVVGSPTELQQDAWAHVMAGHRLAAAILKPGAKARDVYQALRAHLETFAPAKGSFTHHAGHGLGMDAWEFPWLTPGSDHVIQEGEVVAFEPGLYSREMQGGIRLEHNYLVTKDGVTPLDSFPMELR
ncbi:MAG: aminopeptidase P family protein [Bryobacteraceae bacterium]|nr:aminopeptidase P family protein [Bryobacteraceae bacterium]